MSGLFTHLKLFHFMLMCVVNTRDILIRKNVPVDLTLLILLIMVEILRCFCFYSFTNRFVGY